MMEPTEPTLYTGLGYLTKEGDSEFRTATSSLVIRSLTHITWLCHAGWYTYDPAAPFDHAQLEAAVTNILAMPHLQVLLNDRNFIAYIEGTFRVGPYSDDAAREAVEMMLEIWNERLAGYAVEKSKSDENLRIRRARKASSAPEPPITCSNPSLPEAHSTAPPREVLADAEAGPSDSTGEREAPPAGKISKGAKPGDEPPLPVIDESTFAYSAWLMHDNPQLRLLAAARYIDHFDMLNLTLKDDPALDNIARIEAFRLLYNGPRSNVYAARQFLDSFKCQMNKEGRPWIGQGHLPQTENKDPQDSKSFSPDSSQNPNDEFDLSDGEFDDDDESENNI